jgi:phosphatidylserine/phosphatidylglycerophosphate/cardiolipin synthase-like enzyme
MSESSTSSLVTDAGNHVEAALAAATSQVLLASPYMGAGVLADFSKLAKASPATWRVLTKLDAASVAHGSLSIRGLRQLLSAGVGLRSLSNLHAKVVITDQAFGLVGSANFTNTGLGGSGGKANIELGVLLDATQRKAATEHFDHSWDGASLVTEAWIKAVEETANHLPASVSAIIPDAGSTDEALPLGRPPTSYSPKPAAWIFGSKRSMAMRRLRIRHGLTATGSRAANAVDPASPSATLCCSIPQASIAATRFSRSPLRLGTTRLSS